jgi:hypothetical protein
MSIYQLWINGELDRFIKLGIIKPTILYYCGIYHEYLKERQAGNNYTQAVALTSENLCVTEITVKRAIAAVM